MGCRLVASVQSQCDVLPRHNIVRDSPSPPTLKYLHVYIVFIRMVSVEAVSASNMVREPVYVNLDWTPLRGIRISTIAIFGLPDV